MVEKETVQTVQTYGRTYINRYTHTRTPLLTNFLVINNIIYIYINIYLKKNVQIVQFMYQFCLNALFFSKTFVQTVINLFTPILNR